MDQNQTPNSTPQATTATGSSKIILGLIVLLVIGGVAYSALRDDGPNRIGEDGAFSGDLFSLVDNGGDWRCSWTASQDGTDIAGTVMVSRGKFKSSSEISGGGVDVTAHAVGDGEYVYSWTNLTGRGFRFPIEQGTEGVETAVTGTNVQNTQFTEEYEYHCEPWEAESGEFALPSGITFDDMEAMMAEQEGMMEGMMQQY